MEASIRTCGRCDGEIGREDRFCHVCGSPLHGCKSCGAQLGEGDRFCHACGASTGAAAAVAVPLLPPPPGTPTGELRPRGFVRAVWGDSARAYRVHFHHLIPSAMVVEAVAVALQVAWLAIVGHGSTYVVLFLGPGALYLLYFVLAGIHVVEIAEVHEGRHHRNLLEILRQVRPRLPVLFAVGIVFWLLIDLVYLVTFVAAFSTDSPAIGLPVIFVFVLSLWWFMTRSACFAQTLMLEQLGPWAALRRSFQLTKGSFWRLLLIVAVTGTVTAIVGIVLEVIVMPYVYGSSPDARTLSEIGPHDAGGYFASVLSEAVTVPFGLLVGVFIYIHLKRRREFALLAPPAPPVPAPVQNS